MLGRSAATVCAKALASADPAAVLRARLDRELAPEKLVRKLRRARHAAHARDLVESLPPGEPVDWAALEAVHAREPIPYWQDVVRTDGVPEDVRLRHAALLPEPGPDGLPGSARLTRERPVRSRRPVPLCADRPRGRAARGGAPHRCGPGAPRGPGRTAARL
ncbi:hypothetical protein GT043_03090, partial [Streptomyces sp. SID2131]|nr:hypothetical protein [Streptomyces sp. SID2131]